MIDAEGLWADVEVGSYVKDKNGKTWRITDIDFFTDRISMRDREGVERSIASPDPSRVVTYVQPTDDEAVAIVQKMLPGAEVVATLVPGKPWACEAWPKRSLREAQSHLKMVHGVYAGDIKELKSATECHQFSHADESQFNYVPHTHTGESWPR